MHGSIIVPLDGARASECAIPYALSIARRANLPVHLVHLHEDMAPVFASALVVDDNIRDWEVRPSEHEYLQSLQARTQFDHDVEIVTALIEGDVADALDQYLYDVRPSLLVMAPGECGSLERYFQGTSIDYARCSSLPPMLLVHPSDDEAEDDTDVHLNHLLLPLENASGLDGSLQLVFELSSLFEGDCTLFHALDEAGAVDYAPRVTVVASDGAAGCEGIVEVRAQFECLARQMREKGNQVAVRIVDSPYPADSILEEAKSGPINWIAIASQCRPRLSQLMFGNTANRIIHGARVPVLVYPPPQS